MILNKLSEISTIVLLRSDKILHELLQNKQYKEGTSSISNSIKDFAPNSFRLNDIEAIVNSNHIDYDYDILDEFFNEFYIYDGYKVYAKREKLEEYTSIINKIHPFSILGYKMSLLLYEGILDVNSIKNFTTNISPLGFTSDTNKRYSDNHLHLGGANDPILNLWDLIVNKNKNKYFEISFMDKLPRINEFSYINNETFSLGILHNLVNLCLDNIYKYCLNDKIDMELIWCEFHAILKAKKNYIKKNEISLTVLRELEIKEDPNNQIQELFLLFLNYERCDEPIRRWFIFNILCHYIHLSSNCFMINRIIKMFFHITNIIYSYQVMSKNIGLKNFVNYFTSPIRQLSKDKYNNIASNIINSGLKTFEAKIAPNAIFDNEFIKFKIAFDKYILEKQNCPNFESYENNFLQSNSSEYKYHFCIHFIRNDEKNKNEMQQRFSQLRKEVKSQAQNLHKFLYESNTKFSMYYFYEKYHPNKTIVERYKNELEARYIDISKMITSIDVAGDELATPPEVFASAIKYLRHQPKKDAPLNFKKLILSVHAGEDFNHIISGMRKIDETIKFYHMEKNDRLGHALAIGIYPKDWIEFSREIIVTKEELLDNFVWMVEHFKQIVSKSTILYGTIQRYQNYISDLSKEIYSEEFSSYNLYNAWKLREYDFEELEKDFTNDIYNKSSIPLNNIKKESIEYEIYNSYHLDINVKNIGKEKVKIKFSSEMDIFSISEDDLIAYEILQDYMIENISQKEIIIEVNPSSNIYISCLKEYKFHPIFRWYPVDNNLENFNPFNIRKNLLKVCVNTDDPSIFPTTILNEFEHLKNAVQNKYSKKDIELWIEDLRNFGNDIFDYSHQKYEFEI